MVTVTSFAHKNTKEGKAFNVLILQGELEFIPSKTTGKFYATARTCSISCTFNEVVCQGLIGKTLPGSIEKLQCEPYDYTVKETGEVIKLDYSYYYNPNPKTVEQEVFQMKAAA